MFVPVGSIVVGNAAVRRKRWKRRMIWTLETSDTTSHPLIGRHGCDSVAGSPIAGASLILAAPISRQSRFRRAPGPPLHAAGPNLTL